MAPVLRITKGNRTSALNVRYLLGKRLLVLSYSAF
jgi:hypothetical protein